MAVPVLAAGSAIAITGAAIEGVGESALDAGSAMISVGDQIYVAEPLPLPNAAPKLD